MNEFTERLKSLIAGSGKTQSQISAEMGITKQKLSQWKSGYIQPNIDDIIMLAKYFDVSSDYLIGLE